MTKPLLIISFFILILKISVAQNLLNVNEIFDFNIGDKFQYTFSINDNTPPNADRYTITDKYFSDNSDTVFYIRLNDSYYTTFVNGNPPYLEYHFQTIIDTVYYTNLDSLISNSIYWIPYNPDMYTYDTLIYSSGYFCDSLINGYYYTTQFFEPDHFSKKYGKGIGLVRRYYSYPSQYEEWEYSLFYYEKDGIGCGVPDNTTTIDYIENSNEINVYPNPADDYFIIDFKTLGDTEINIFSSDGKLIDKKSISNQSFLYDSSSLKAGIYFIYIKTSSYSYSKKLLIR